MGEETNARTNGHPARFVKSRRAYAGDGPLYRHQSYLKLARAAVALHGLTMPNIHPLVRSP